MNKKLMGKYIKLKIEGDEYVEINGTVLPYIVNRYRTIYGHGIEGDSVIHPFQDHETGFLMVTL